MKIRRVDVDSNEASRGVCRESHNSSSDDEIIRSSKSLVEFELEDLRITSCNPPSSVLEGAISFFLYVEYPLALDDVRVDRSFDELSAIHLDELGDLINHDRGSLLDIGR